MKKTIPIMAAAAVTAAVICSAVFFRGRAPRPELPSEVRSFTTSVPAGTTVTYLTTMFNSGAWDYIETIVDGKVARGFIPDGALDLLNESDTDGEG